MNVASALILAVLVGTQVAPGSDARSSVAEAVERASERLSELDALLERSGDARDLRVERLWHLYVLGVGDRSFLDEGDMEIDRILAMAERPDPSLMAVLNAYSGVFEVVRAKHASWPFHKLDHVNRGLERLDAAVEAEPRDPRIRYLRLTSCFPLPFFLGRRGSVNEDAEALARLLLEGQHDLVNEDVQVMAAFLLDECDLADETRRALRKLI